MFEKLSTLALQQYWWFLVALLAGAFVFMTFVQGGQSLLWQVAKDEERKDLIVNALGRKWELGFTSLVVFGGALFASFPLFYSVSFGGAYFVWMAILFSFIIQAVAYEFRKKPDNFLGQRTYELFMLINGTLGVFLIGAALGTLFSGGNFVVNEYHLSHWTKPTYGLEALADPFNLGFGLMLVFLSRVLGELFLINRIEDIELVDRLRKSLRVDTVLLLIFFFYVVGSILMMKGYGYDEQGVVYVADHKYLSNLFDMPAVTVAFLVGVAGLLVGIATSLFGKSDLGIWWSGMGAFLIVVSLFLILGYDHTVYYPSLSDLQSSLTIENSSSSRYTLIAMSYVSLMVPFVLAYIWYAWKAMESKKLSKEEIESDPHHY